MRTDVRQLERPVPEARGRSADDRGDEMSPEIRELILRFGRTDQLSAEYSESTLEPETSVSE